VAEEQKEKVYRIEGLDCPDCALTIEKQLRKLPGIGEVKVDFVQAELKVRFERNAQELEKELSRSISRAGYRLARPGWRWSSFRVQGMDCADEAGPIERALRKKKDVRDIRFNLIEQIVQVYHSTSENEIVETIKKAGFDAVPVLDGGQARKVEPGAGRVLRRQRLLLWVTGLLVLSGIGLISWVHYPFAGRLLILGGILLGGYRIARKGLVEARALRLGINFLMTVAVIGAMVLGEWQEGGMVVFLFALANYLEERSMERARRGIRELMDLSPPVANLLKDGQVLEVPVEKISVGQKILIRPGERIPLDGEIVEGRSRINEAPVTGESRPVRKTAGDEVFAGSLNGNGALVVRVSRPYSDSTIQRIIHLVQEAQASRARSQRFVDRFAAYYTPIVVGFSVLVAVLPPLFWGQAFAAWVYRALVLLVISCPCALVIATPVTFVSALTSAMRQGILVKGGIYLEDFARVRVLALDKTGTLTFGRPKVEYILTLNDLSESEVLQTAASVELNSEHPLATAVVEAAREKGLELRACSAFRALPGKGVEGVVNGDRIFIGNHAFFEERRICDPSVHARLAKIEKANQTAVLVGSEDRLFGILAISDAVRPRVKEAIRQMRSLGIDRIVMLTGDNHRTAEAVARKIGVDVCYSELMPDQKLEKIHALRREFGSVAMVGDGINDAPALAAASVGISMGASATDTALEIAHIALLKDDLGKLPFLRQLAGKTLTKVRENIFLAIGMKGLFLALAMVGMATLWMAVIADMGTSLFVIFNGMRLLRYKS
jgi:Cd2+/Zn2+-exporting ATPase